MTLSGPCGWPRPRSGAPRAARPFAPHVKTRLSINGFECQAGGGDCISLANSTANSTVCFDLAEAVVVQHLLRDSREPRA